MILTKHAFAVFLIFMGYWGLAQKPVPVGLTNPSFEDTPQHSKPPVGWFYCGAAGESPPDVHPSGMFNVSHAPFDGETYVGMVTRDNETWEGLGQRLDKALNANTCYTFTLHATRSDSYSSYSKLTRRPASYTEPIILRIWGGNYNCEEKELLAISDKIVDTSWQAYNFIFRPKLEHTHFFIEAFYNSDGNDFPYNGNVLIDNASPIIPADCETGAPLLEIEQLYIDEANYETKIDIQTLKEIIAIEGQQITFDRLDELEKHLVQVNNRTIQYINKHLWKISEALKRAPGEKLIIALDADNPYAVIQRQSNIEALFDTFGLSPSRYRFKAYKKIQKSKEWLWDIEGANFLMRLY